MHRDWFDYLSGLGPLIAAGGVLVAAVGLVVTVRRDRAAEQARQLAQARLVVIGISTSNLPNVRVGVENLSDNALVRLELVGIVCPQPASVGQEFRVGRTEGDIGVLPQDNENPWRRWVLRPGQQLSNSDSPSMFAARVDKVDHASSPLPLPLRLSADEARQLRPVIAWDSSDGQRWERTGWSEPRRVKTLPPDA